MALTSNDMHEMTARAVRLLLVKELMLEITADYRQLFSEIQRLNRENEALRARVYELEPKVRKKK